jgi:SH3 domain protein
MKINFPYPLIIIFWIVFFASPLLAKDIYVIGITQITMRTAPGVDHKIVAMLKSGTKLEVVKYQRDWSQVETNYGKKGWVLSRFLTKKIPDAFWVDKLRIENQDLISKLKKAENESKNLANAKTELVQVKEKYNKLKHDSEDFFKLEKKYEIISQQFEMQTNQIKGLENDLNSEQRLWFLSGGGVFIVGLFFGLSVRKKKRSSLL